MASNEQLWENALIELKALLKTEDNEGYGTMKIGSTRAVNEWHAICEWFYEFVDHYNFDRELVSVALNCYGRYMDIVDQRSEDTAITPSTLQRIAITSIFIVIKIHCLGEECSPNARVRALSRLVYGHFEAREILDTEKDMLHELNWLLHPPTMHTFALSFGRLHPLGANDENLTNYLSEMTRYQMELAVFYPELLMNYKPSVLAFAGMLRAEEELDSRVLPKEMRDEFSSFLPAFNMNPSHVLEAKAALENLIPQIPNVAQYETFKVGEPAFWQQDHDGRAGSTSPTGVAED